MRKLPINKDWWCSVWNRVGHLVLYITSYSWQSLSQNERLCFSHSLLLYQGLILLLSQPKFFVCRMLSIWTKLELCLVKRVNPFPNKLLFLCVWNTCLLKIMLEKEQLPLTRNFSFSHIVFYLFGKPYPHFHRN